MAGSWRRLHYVQRPAKNIERKMLAELLRRLDRIRMLEDWRYVGLGSVYFADFALFHRTLGLTNMVNIEKLDTDENRARFAFNRPYGCIDLKWGPAGEVLTTLTWDSPTIVWLDYDGKLDSDMLGDIGQVLTAATPPTALFVTVNAEPGGDVHDEALNAFEERVTPERMPNGVVADDVGGWGLAELSYKVIVAEIAAAVADRNGLAARADVTWHQLVHLRYSDGARMMTLGGLLASNEEADSVQTAGLHELFFARTGAEPYRIRVPNLTTREVLQLGGQMPAEPQDLAHHGVPPRELAEYAAAYRYFPAFIDADF